MATLTIKGLSKRYGKTPAVEDFDLHVEDKEFVVLVGPSGCGKTTVLNSVAGLFDIDEGEIWFGDELVNAPARKVFKIPQKREVAMVFQDYAIYPHMTVFGNIAFPLSIRRTSKQEIETRVGKAARLLEIDHLLDRKPKALSGGQRQRIALGRAMVRNPKIFLLDEPLANLDAKLRVHARMELKKLQQELGVTTIFVTHDQVEAMTMGDRIAVMNNGRLEQIGTPSELYTEPANTFVAKFIGSPPMNLMEGSLVASDRGPRIDLGFSPSPHVLSPSLVERIRGAGITEITLGIRPEHITIGREHLENSVEATVEYAELTGKEVNVYLDLGGEPLIAISGSGQDLEKDERVWITLDSRRIHLFDRTSGRRIE